MIKYLKTNKGQTLVEFALVITVFLSVLLALLDIGIMMYVNLTLQNAVREGARYSVTGQTINSTTSRRASMEQVIKNHSNGLYDRNPHVLTTQKVTPGSSTFANVTGANTGAPGDIIIVNLNYTWPLLTPLLKPFFRNGQYKFDVRATMTNEPFPTGG